MREPCELSQQTPTFLLQCEHAKAAGLKPRVCFRNLAVPQVGVRGWACVHGRARGCGWVA